MIAALTLEMMRARLRQDVDFKRVPTLLEEKVAEMNARPDRACFFESHYLPKFWCLLAWIEQYWTDSKRLTCEQCDYTFPPSRPRSPSLWHRPARSRKSESSCSARSTT